MKDPVEVERIQTAACREWMLMHLSLWQHWLHGTYRVIHVAVDEVTLTPVVVYASVERGYVWTRPLSEWNAIVTLDDGTKTTRFRRVT